MDRRDYESLRDYVGFDEQAERQLADLLPVLEPAFEGLVADFYEAIQAHPRARAAIRGGEAQVARLKRSLARWLLSVVQGPRDEHYLAQHSRIGSVHVEIGLPQELMFTAMNRIRVGLVAAMGRFGAAEPSAVRAVHQVLDLELAVMLDSYREESHRRIRMGMDHASAQSALIREYEMLSHQLRESEQRTRDIVDGVPAFVAAISESGEITFWNRQLERVTGFFASEMVGQSGRELFGEGGTRRLPLRAGGHRLVRWGRTTVGDSGGTYVLGVDVTDEAEMQMRTARAERLAAVGTLAAGLAHEVRNPLNSASLQLQALRRRLRRGECSEEQLASVIERVKSELSRLDDLVEEFLQFARPSRLELKPTDLNALVREVLALLRPELSQSRLELCMELAPDVGRLSLDASQMRQVLLNLVRNALQAMHAGGTLTVRTLAADEQARVRLEIEDTGEGFAPEAPIFDAFFTTKSNGTGLGLSIVHRIVENHGGSIAAESTPGKTVFRVQLPQPHSTGSSAAQGESET